MKNLFIFRLYEETLTMIEFVKSKGFLYDRKDADYNKNQKKNAAWEKISEILQNKSRKWTVSGVKTVGGRNYDKEI